MVVLVAAIPVLATIGYRTLRDTTTGRRIDAQNDPTKPRYEANVLPTPVVLLVEMGADNSLQGLTMLALGPNDTGGAAVFIPPSTVAPACRRHARHVVEHVRYRATSPRSNRRPPTCSGSASIRRS